MSRYKGVAFSAPNGRQVHLETCPVKPSLLVPPIPGSQVRVDCEPPTDATRHQSSLELLPFNLGRAAHRNRQQWTIALAPVVTQTTPTITTEVRLVVNQTVGDYKRTRRRLSSLKSHEKFSRNCVPKCTRTPIRLFHRPKTNARRRKKKASTMPLTGHCLCQAVTYSADVESPLMTGYDHCDDCQRQSGSTYCMWHRQSSRQTTYPRTLHTQTDNQSKGSQTKYQNS